MRVIQCVIMYNTFLTVLMHYAKINLHYVSCERRFHHAAVVIFQKAGRWSCELQRPFSLQRSPLKNKNYIRCIISQRPKVVNC